MPASGRTWVFWRSCPSISTTSRPRSSRGRRSMVCSAPPFRGRVRAVFLVTVLLTPAAAWPHAFPDHFDPRVGHTVEAPPTQVRIWFDGEIEPVFSSIRVENAEKQQVDNKDGRVSPQDPPRLEGGLR